MIYFWWITGTLIGLVWVWRVTETIIHLPSLPDLTRPEWDIHPDPAPRISVVVPARNEEECIRQCLTSLLKNEYPDFEIIAVNDRSTDGTGVIMDELAASPTNKDGRLHIIHVKELPVGWLGKTHAMWRAAAQSTGEWLLFTDGDIFYRKDTLRRSVACAEKQGADHFVLFPTMLMETFGERMMIGFFQVMFVFGCRAWKVADPNARDFIGAGAFGLVRRSVYEAVGTFERMRLEVIDDLMLAYRVKKSGYAQRIAFAPGMISLRWGKGALGIAGNLTKNSFSFFQFNWFYAFIGVAAFSLLNLGPFLGAVFAPGWAKAGPMAALIMMFLLYVGFSRKSNVSPLFMLLHWVSTGLFAITVFRSAWQAKFGGGVTWRGTQYSVKEIIVARERTLQIDPK